MKIILLNENKSIFLSHKQTSTYIHYFITEKSKYNYYIISINRKDKSFYYSYKLGKEYPVLKNDFYIKYNIDKIMIYH